MIVNLTDFRFDQWRFECEDFGAKVKITNIQDGIIWVKVTGNETDTTFAKTRLLELCE